MSAAAERPTRYRRPWAGPLCEWVLLACLLLAAGLALTAQQRVDVGADVLAHVRTFYRETLLGVVKLGGERVVPYRLLLLLAGLGLALLAALPRVRPEVRGAVAAYGVLLLLAPVINYDAQVEVLKMLPADARMLAEGLPPAQRAAIDPDRFDPVLPVTWPLLVAAVVVGLWFVVTPSAERSAAAAAFAAVTVLLVAGGSALTHQLLLARGNALDFELTQWPSLLAAVWLLGQLGTACTAAVAVGSNPFRSRLLAGSLALLALLTVALTGAGR
ncbi:MAG: hypothetical protein IT204_10000 [Fimbriimonadaceae bacterium]|nr:hypothetical protein [Fimbriimonadaceae bacterium]